MKHLFIIMILSISLVHALNLEFFDSIVPKLSKTLNYVPVTLPSNIVCPHLQGTKSYCSIQTFSLFSTYLNDIHQSPIFTNTSAIISTVENQYNAYIDLMQHGRVSYGSEQKTQAMIKISKLKASMVTDKISLIQNYMKTVALSATSLLCAACSQPEYFVKPPFPYPEELLDQLRLAATAIIAEPFDKMYTLHREEQNFYGNINYCVNTPPTYPINKTTAQNYTTYCINNFYGRSIYQWINYPPLQLEEALAAVNLIPYGLYFDGIDATPLLEITPANTTDYVFLRLNTLNSSYVNYFSLITYNYTNTSIYDLSRVVPAGLTPTRVRSQSYFKLFLPTSDGIPPYLPKRPMSAAKICAISIPVTLIFIIICCCGYAYYHHKKHHIGVYSES